MKPLAGCVGQGLLSVCAGRWLDVFGDGRDCADHQGDRVGVQGTGDSEDVHEGGVGFTSENLAELGGGDLMPCSGGNSLNVASV